MGRAVCNKMKATKIILIWACSALSLTTKIVDASSNGGSSRNAPFLVTSEIIVQSSDADGNNGGANKSDIQRSAAGSNRNGGGADGSIATDLKGDDSSGIYFESNVDGSTDEHILSGGGAGGSDTDGEDDDELVEINSLNKNHREGKSDESVRAEPPTGSSYGLAASSDSPGNASQPLRTLKKLQAMLDDTDYATHTLASPATTVVSSTGTVDEVVSASQSSSQQDPSPIQSSTLSAPDSGPGPEKLWMSKDRAKYRRTRRTEKQRQQQQQLEYEEHHARKIRDIQRQRIIREERERKELEELRRKQVDVMERQKRYEGQKKRQQQPFLRFDEAADFTDEDTDTDGGKGFELPNLPVYLSDAETDDFSEETDDAPKMRQSPHVRPASNYVPPNTQQNFNQMPPPQNMGQNNGSTQPYQYNYPQVQQNQNQQQQQQQPPPQANDPYQNYQQQYPPYSQHQQQHQQQQTIPQQYPYGQSDNRKMQQDNQRQYEQQYAAWAQAAANGYYYPPPQPNPDFQHPQSQQAHQQAQQAQQQPMYQYPYAAQQPHNQGASYIAQQQHSYLAQHHHHTGSQPSTTPYPPIPPQQYPPESQMAQGSAAYQGSEQNNLFTRENDVVGDEPSAQQQQEQTQYIVSQTNNVELRQKKAPVSTHTNADLTDLTEPMAVSETDTMTSAEANITASIPRTSSSIIGGKTGVKSAFVSPLISPLQSSSSVAGPISAEGPYCELEDESVSSCQESPVSSFHIHFTVTLYFCKTMTIP